MFFFCVFGVVSVWCVLEWQRRMGWKWRWDFMICKFELWLWLCGCVISLICYDVVCAVWWCELSGIYAMVVLC